MEPKNELQRNAIAEARRIELETFQRALDIQWLNNRMEDGRMGRCLALIQKEAEMEKDFQERTDHAAIVNARAEKETALGIEIAKVRRDEARELLRRHYLRERDPGLRELSKKFQAGYVCRDLRQQILHNEYKRQQEKAEDKQANAVLCNALFNDKEAAYAEEKKKMERESKYRTELQSQIVNKEAQRQCMYEDSLVEKKMLEEIMRTMADEDHKELNDKRAQMERTRNEMKTFSAARDAWRRKHAQMVIQEEKEIELQRQAAADRTTAIIEARERKVREKEEINERIVAKIQAAEAIAEERANTIKSLQEQEFLEKNANDDIKAREKLEWVKRDTKDSLTSQMETKKRLARDQRLVEAEFRKKTEAKVAAEDAKEREKEWKKKEKGRAYSRELLKQIEDNKKRRDVDKMAEEARAQRVWDSHSEWKAEVSKEREKIIREHAPPLVGYLQAGVLKPTDLGAVREGAAARGLGDMDIEALAVSNRPKRFSKCNAQCKILRDY